MKTEYWAEVEDRVRKISLRRESLEARRSNILERCLVLLEADKKLSEDREKVKCEIKDVMDAIAKLKYEKDSTPDFDFRFEKTTSVTKKEDTIIIDEHRTLYKKAPLEKRQIKTLLHSVLDEVNEKGRISAKDLAKELGVDENEVRCWAAVMEKRGMLRLNYTMAGNAVLEKNPAAC